MLALFAAEMGLRVAREARLTSIQERGAQAYYVAEAGFNRVRASIIDRSFKVNNYQICSTGASHRMITDSITASDGSVIGSYSVDVTCSGSDYIINSDGHTGAGATAGYRKIYATVTVNGTINTPDGKLNTTKTTYKQ